MKLLVILGLFLLLNFKLSTQILPDRALNSRDGYTKLLDSIVFEERNPNIGYQKTKNSFEYNSNYTIKSNTDYYWDTTTKKYNFYKFNFKYISENPYIYERSYDSLGININTIRYKQIDSNSAFIRSKFTYKFENNSWKLTNRLDSFLNPISVLVDSILNYRIDSNNKLYLLESNYFEYYPDTRLKYRYTSDRFVFGNLHEHRYYDQTGKWASLIMTNKKDRDTNYKEDLFYDNQNNLDSVQYSSWVSTGGITSHVNGGYTKFKYDKTIEFKNVLSDYSNKYYGKPYQNLLIEEIEANNTNTFYSTRKFYYSDNKYNTLNITQNSEINIHPNPVNNSLTIETEKPIYFKLSDLFGREILIKEFHQSSNLDLHNIPNGLYIYQIFNQKNEPIQSNKLEIKH